MEQAGRILRAQATRRQVFLSVLPLLSEGLIRPAEGKRPAKKDYRARIEVSKFCDMTTRQVHEQATLFLKLRAPTAQGKGWKGKNVHE